MTETATYEENYVKWRYAVPNDLYRRVEHKGRGGIICEIKGNYVNVLFDDRKPGDTSYVHPTDPNLKYLEEFGKVRQMTRGQKRYHDWRHSDCCETFTEWIKGRMYKHYER